MILGIALIVVSAVAVPTLLLLGDRQKRLASRARVDAVQHLRDLGLSTVDDDVFLLVASPRVLAWVDEAANTLLFVPREPGARPAPLRRAPPTALAWPTTEGTHWRLLDPRPRLDDMTSQGRRLAMDSERWPQLAGRIGLRLEEGELSGQRDEAEVRLRREHDHIEVEVQVGESPTARPGRGRSGNAVLDLLLHTEGVPDEAAQHVLALVHGGGLTLYRGRLRGRWVGTVKALLEHIDGLQGR